MEKNMANKKIQITLSDEVLAKLENLAKEKGVSKSAMISILISEEK
jgi:metal-responsive CopG/Arc/MetJ family transcriptional regulator